MKHSFESALQTLSKSAKNLPGFEQNQKKTENEVQNEIGCENKIWLFATKKNDTFYFSADSEGRILRGLLAILLDEINGKSKNELLHFDSHAFFEQKNLLFALSNARKKRLNQIDKKIKQIIST